MAKKTILVDALLYFKQQAMKAIAKKSAILQVSFLNCHSKSQINNLSPRQKMPSSLVFFDE